MADFEDPPRRRRKKRAKRIEPAFDPNNPHATLELETADLTSLGQSGVVDAVHKTRPLDREAAVVVDLGPEPATFPDSTPSHVVTPRTITPLAKQRSGIGIVLVVYILATAALGLSIYVRFF